MDYFKLQRRSLWMCVYFRRAYFVLLRVVLYRSFFLSLLLSGQNGSSARLTLSLSSNYTSDLIQMKNIPLHPSDPEPHKSPPARLATGLEPTARTGSVCEFRRGQIHRRPTNRRRLRIERPRRHPRFQSHASLPASTSVLRLAIGRGGCFSNSLLTVIGRRVNCPKT